MGDEKNSKKDTALTNKPKDSKFKQQRLDAWQPILTPTWVIGTFIVVGSIFIIIGAVLVSQAATMFEIVQIYDNGEGTTSCSIRDLNEGYTNISSPDKDFTPCDVTFNFTRDIDSDETVYIYYELHKVYQNHRLYVKSRSDDQLRGQVAFNSNPNSIKSDLATCDPEESLETDDGLIAYPCGLIALSYFNDGIQLKSFERSGDVRLSWVNTIPVDTDSNTELSINTNDIAWDTDLSEKFRNPTVEMNSGVNTGNAKQYGTYQYLWQTYDQFSCYDISNPSQRLQCDNWTVVANEQTPGVGSVPGAGCARCTNEEEQKLVNEGGIPEPLDYSNSLSPEGLRNENFIVWMRTAALPTFRKLYGTLDLKGTSFKKGDQVTFSIIPNFLVSSFGGQKGLVIGTTSPLGSKNDVLGIAYLVVGCIAMVLALLFFIKLKVNPRTLGDPKYLHAKSN